MGIIDKKNDEYLIYKYKVKEIYLLFSDENYKLENERLNDITIMDHYIENLYPVIKIDLALEESVYNRIIKVKLNIRKYYRKNSDEKKSFESNYINEVFTLILDDTVDTLNTKAHNAEYPEGDTNQMNSVTTTMELFLFKGDLIRSNTMLFNAVLKEANVSAAIGYLLTKIGAKNILMRRPDNMTIYDELKIPPLKLSKALAFVDSYYGIYNTGSIIYFGLHRGYIIPFCRPSEVYESGEVDTVVIIVPSIGSQITDNICEVKKYSDSSKKYLIADPSSFSPTNRGVTGTILNSENIEVVENDTGETSSTKGKNKRTEVLPSENPFYKAIYDASVKSNESVISVSFKDADFSNITPNKKYQFIFEDTSLSKKYKGTYFLCQCDISFVKESKDLTAGAQCVFRKSVV